MKPSGEVAHHRRIALRFLGEIAEASLKHVVLCGAITRPGGFLGEIAEASLKPFWHDVPGDRVFQDSSAKSPRPH